MMSPLYILVVVLFAMPYWQSRMSIHKTQAIRITAQKRLSAESSVAPLDVSGTPQRIVLPSQGIDVSIVPGYFDSSHMTWTVANSTANYIVGGIVSNTQPGETLVYGHWSNAVFGKTNTLKPGDTAYVYTTNNHVLKYTFTSKELVSPTDLSVLHSKKNSPGLSLMTCDGVWAQYRRIMHFNLAEAV